MKRTFSIFLSLLILTTNVGITFAAHYCEGKVVKTSISFWEDSINCGMTDMSQPCENESQSSTVKRKSCCENTFVQLKIEDNYNTPTIAKSTVDFNFIVAFLTTHINLYSCNASTEAEYLKYSPPLLTLDIPVLIQSFLI